MSAKFVIKETKNGQYMFNLKASNGEIILTSEMYKAKSSAKKGIKSVKVNAVKLSQFKKLTASNDAPYFVLRAGNNQVIGKSEMYTSSGAMENGIESVKNNAPGAEIVDLTK